MDAETLEQIASDLRYAAGQFEQASRAARTGCGRVAEDAARRGLDAMERAIAVMDAIPSAPVGV